MKKQTNYYIFDGAMGTYYGQIGRQDIPCEMANLLDDETIKSIHRAYIEAGAVAIKTNTFAAQSGLFPEKLRDEIIKRGIDLALEAAKGREVDVFASIGPLPKEILDPKREYKSIVDLFLQRGIDHFLFETLDSPEYIVKIANYIKEENPQAYIQVSFAINRQGETRAGFLGQYLLDVLSQEPAIDGLGFNCLLSPYHMKDYLESLDLPQHKNISIMPNAGYPQIVGRRAVYKTDPGYFAQGMREIADMGVAILGGCCGTCPEDIEALSQTLKDLPRPQVQASEKSQKSRTQEGKNTFYDKLKAGQKVLAVEFDPPEDLDMEAYILRAKILKQARVDAITIADCPMASPRISPALVAYKLKHEVKMDSVVHMTCRDRNLNALKAILLGMASEDILNALVITGDPIPTAQRDEVKRVFHFNSSNLIGYIERLNRDVLPKRIEIGAALNINALNFDTELYRAKEKIKNGATVFYTQPVLSQRAIDNLKLARKDLDAYLLGGIMPLISYRNASFVKNEISGIEVEDEIVQQFKDLEPREARKLGIDISLDMMRAIESEVDGFYLITPFQMTDLIGDLIDKYQEEK